MKKTLWAAVALVAMVTLIPLTAQSTQGTQPPQGPGRGMGRGFGGPGGPGRIGPVFQRLDLTDAQREQIKAIMEERRESRPGANMMELQKQLQAALLADAVDNAKIEQLKAAITSAEAAMLSARIETELKISQLLTPEQRAKARELIAQGPGAGFGRGPGRGRGWHGF